MGGKAGQDDKSVRTGEIELASMKVDDDFAIIMDRLAYSSKDMAEKIAKDIGCEGIHEHDFQERFVYAL